MDKVLAGNEYVIFHDSDYDRIFQGILIDLEIEELTKDNLDTICCYFNDNILDILDNQKFDEDTDFSDIMSGFKEYLKSLIETK